jgi:peptidoglycan L-alanyl-D-glutamate endopeptidase CwlK
MRSSQLAYLHPLLRDKVPALEGAIATAGLPLRLFESYRSPFRQRELYAARKSRARAWESFHQYGLAVDYVFWVNGDWSWQEPAPGYWKIWRGIIEDQGLRALSFEEPHAEMPVHLADLEAGRIPPGDFVWRANLATEAERWGTAARTFKVEVHPGAPPWTLDLGERPALGP